MQDVLDEIWDGTIDRSTFSDRSSTETRRLPGRSAALAQPDQPDHLPVAVTASVVRVDAVLLTELSASRLFGYTRSYFHVWPGALLRSSLSSRVCCR